MLSFNMFSPCLLGDDTEQIIARATICENGDLTTNYEYLREYVNNTKD